MLANYVASGSQSSAGSVPGVKGRTQLTASRTLGGYSSASVVIHFLPYAQVRSTCKTAAATAFLTSPEGDIAATLGGKATAPLTWPEGEATARLESKATIPLTRPKGKCPLSTKGGKRL